MTTPVLRSEGVSRTARWTIAERLFDAVPAAVAVMRGVEDLVLEYVNPACVTLWQRRSATELLNRPLLEALPEMKEQLAYVEMLRTVVSSGESLSRHEAPVLIQGHEGLTTRYFDFTYSPVTNAEGVVDGVWVFAFDVTQVVLARHEIELANRAKDEFLATMSHELRTPLNAILGWTAILQSEDSDEAKRARGLAVIERNGQMLARIVGDLLDVSRIISGKLRLHVAPTNLPAVVGAALDAVRSAAESRGVTLVTSFAPDLTPISADAHRLQQVIWNLLSNAVRFTPKDGEVRISANALGERVLLEVQDTGQGIPAEHLPHIFERFRQVDSSTTRAHGGLGLGLSIVRYLVEAHGGTVAAASEGPNRGATFTIELPRRAQLAESSSDHDQPPSTLNESASTSASAYEAPRSNPLAAPLNAALAGVRVLIVDDEPDALELLRLQLEKAGASVTAVPSASAALSAVGPFDVIVSDIGMPEMDGYAFMQELRAREVGVTSVPAIALTAYARAEDAARAQSAGYHTHVTKPFRPDELVSLIRSYAGRSPVNAR